MQLFVSPTHTLFQTRQTEKFSNTANQATRWISPSLDFVSFSASSARPTSIHFGNTITSTDDTAAIELMDALLPRLSEATNWQVKHHLDRFANFNVGRDLSFSLGNTRFTLREMNDTKNLPAGMNKGTALISEDSSGKKEYPIAEERVFNQYQSKFMRVASPILGKLIIERIVNQANKLSEPSYHGYIGTQNAKASISFSVNGVGYYLSIDPAKESYYLAEKPVFSEQEIEGFWHANKERNTIQNDEENLRKFPSLEVFKADFPKRSFLSIEHKLTPELYKQLYESIKGPFEENFLREFGIGLEFNPRPLIRPLANQFLNDLQNVRMEYRDKECRKLTYYPNQNSTDNHGQNGQYFTISKFQLDNNTERYEIRSYNGKQGYICFEVLNAQDSELLDDVIAIAKVKSKLDFIALVEPFLKEIVNQEKQELLQNQTQLLANLAAKLAALTD